MPREYFGMVFSLKQTGVPIGFALAGLIFPLLLQLGRLARRQPGRRRRCRRWRRSSSSRCAPASTSSRVAGKAVGRHLAVDPLRARATAAARARAARPSSTSIAQHTFTFYLVTYLYEHCGLSIARAGFLLSASQIVGTAVRLLSGGMGDRIPRMQLLGWTGIGMTVGCVATGLLEPDTPFWLITLVVIGYGSVVISWNGTSQAEFAHLSPPGEAAAVAAVQTALAFSGAVFGPPLFALIASAVELSHGLLRRRGLRARRPRSGRSWRRETASWIAT